MPTPVWRGSEGIHLQPSYPLREKTPEGVRISLVYRGPYLALIENEPDVLILFTDLDEVYTGALDEDIFEGLYLAAVETSPDGVGSQGPGTQRLLFQPINPGATTEVDVGILEKPIETHPYYSLITSAQWARFNTWEAEPDPTLKGDLQYKIPGTEEVETLTGILAGLAQKKLSGTTTYILPAPIVRRTSTSLEEPETGGVGKISDPGSGPEGYQWLKTADRAIFRKSDGRWERIEEWTGAEAWDSELYPEEEE